MTRRTCRPGDAEGSDALAGRDRRGRFGVGRNVLSGRFPRGDPDAYDGRNHRRRAA